MKAKKKLINGWARSVSIKAPAGAGERNPSEVMVMRARSVIDERSGERKLVIRFNHTQGARRSAILDEALINERSELKKALLKHGADLPVKAEEQNKVINSLLETHERTDRTLAVKPGFKGKTGFVLGPRRLGTAKKTHLWHLSHSQRQAGYIGARKGTITSWNESVGAICKHSSFAIFAVCAALCAPLSQYVKDRLDAETGTNRLVSETATFMFLGDSSTGKTNLATIAMSIMGNEPLEDWNVTPRRLAELAEAHNNLLLILDDAEKVKFDESSLKVMLQHIAQCIPSGKSKSVSAMAQKAGLPDLLFDTWGLVSALDNQDTPFDKCGWRPSAGALARLIPIPIPTSSQGGIFDRLTDHGGGVNAESEKLTNELDGAIAANFGTIFPKWIKFLLKENRTPEVIRLRDEFVVESVVVSDGIDNRLARKFGAVYAAGVLASQAGFLIWPAADIKACVLKCYKRALAYRTNLLGSWKKPRQRLLEALQDTEKFAKVRNGEAVLSEGMLGVRTKYKGKNVLAVRNDELLAFCGDESKAHLINSLKTDGLLICGRNSKGTIQLPVRLAIQGTVVKKPRFWVVSRKALKKVTPMEQLQVK